MINNTNMDVAIWYVVGMVVIISAYLAYDTVVRESWVYNLKIGDTVYYWDGSERYESVILDIDDRREWALISFCDHAYYVGMNDLSPM